MEKHSTEFVGLDVHKETTAIGRACDGRSLGRFVGTVGPSLTELLKSLKSIGRPEQLSIVYEAGPCGYGLVRELRSRGYACEVIAPSKIPRRSGDRIKTDRRDAVRLAELARAGELTNVLVPDERDEAIRDLSRAREDAVRARLAARHQLKAMLLRHGHRYGRSSWTQAHERYLAKITFAHAAQDATFAEYRQAVSEANERVRRLVDTLRDQCAAWRMQPLLQALMTLRGIDFVAAVTMVAELGDLKRFAHPRDLMSFLGLVPSEHTSGDSRHLGKITKTGNGHVRRILIEAAWNYRFAARMSVVLQKRQEGQSKVVRDIAWRAQLRLAQRYRRLSARHLHHNKVCVAIARELAGFIWDIGRHVLITDTPLKVPNTRGSNAKGSPAIAAPAAL